MTEDKRNSDVYTNLGYYSAMKSTELQILIEKMKIEKDFMDAQTRYFDRLASLAQDSEVVFRNLV